MTQKEKAQMRLNCLYGAISITGVNSSSFSPITKGENEQPRKRPTTEQVLVEAKKLSEWVLGEKRKISDMAVDARGDYK